MTEHKHPHIDMHEVNGSEIHSIGYDPATQTLRIAFPNRKTGLVQSTYDYANVTQATFDDLMKADSKGEYFEWHIKPHTETYPYKKLVVEEKKGD